ncbi:MAG TPA: MHYT domain-containing protein [Streptosporangiaceae bacterium]
MLTVHNFSYGLITPGLAYLMSVVGSFLGLRCTSRSRASSGASRVRWLVLGGGSIGITGIWVMHFIAMLGFTIPSETIYYNVPVTLLSMLISVVFVTIGLLIVGLSDTMRLGSLLVAGVVTGVGVAAMHYSGMAAMRMPGRMSYNPGLFALSILIAIVAATAALWFALRLGGFWPGFFAALIMGVAVSGMHYTGMAAMRVYPPSGSPMAMGGADAAAFLLPLIVGVSVTTFVLTAAIALSPTAAEISEEAELMRKIEGLQAQTYVNGNGNGAGPSRTRDDDNPNFRPTLRQ